MAARLAPEMHVPALAGTPRERTTSAPIAPNPSALQRLPAEPSPEPDRDDPDRLARLARAA